MSHYYRLYYMNARSGRVEEFDADSDVEATGRADTRLDDKPLELWRGAHKIMRLEPDSDRHSDRRQAAE